ncbi:MAG: sulfurtransferase TusA family protein [Oscillospiraceae bacterium]|nr:sulfurtransferase TusA family protein [Oscillospiraceae bacterium]
MIDATGYSCPTPVLMVQKEVKAHAPKTLEVLADNRCAVENVSRFARNNGYAVAVTEREDDFLLKLEK